MELSKNIEKGIDFNKTTLRKLAGFEYQQKNISKE